MIITVTCCRRARDGEVRTGDLVGHPEERGTHTSTHRESRRQDPEQVGTRFLSQVVTGGKGR